MACTVTPVTIPALTAVSSRDRLCPHHPGAVDKDMILPMIVSWKGTPGNQPWNLT
jgi:hypothetical protein